MVLTLVALALLAALLLGGACLAGYTFFLLNQASPRQIRPDTWWLYWQAYGHLPAQRTRLLLAAALPCALLLGVLLMAVLALLPRPRALYGDARWASEREIRDAGLL
ncbi:type IV secretory pathway TraG/TraD family ATPase VirD4 [Duganella sp. SG902]|uniref:hypothetical protein n=1 Tax=Duganella sp. SG902 TaxID=2587016 RepID=UPI00159D8B56|nr:hypothetical protein [Duganella sp. SG902]NVM77458.1 type IV secretory pathway TraG/TraD family ATPase VirD4 [Duganella sp. SG902]